MKLEVRSFIIAVLTVTLVPWIILLVWCSINGFGFELINLYEKLHPSGALSLVFNINNPYHTRIPGIIINTLYLAADGFILSFAFVTVYNLCLKKFNTKK